MTDTWKATLSKISLSHWDLKISSFTADNFICWGWQHYLLKTKMHTKCWLWLRKSLSHIHMLKYWHVRILLLSLKTSTHSCTFYKLCWGTITSHIHLCSLSCTSISWLLILSEDFNRCTNYTKWNFYLELKKIWDYIHRRARRSQLPSHNESNLSLVIIEKFSLPGERLYFADNC